MDPSLRRDVLKHCLACSREFPPTAELEFLSVGRRVAFDADRGRLWIVCSWCGHWSLAPIEERWEAVEELERRARGRSTVLGATDRISLLALGGLEAIRVGPAPAREEAWWRYGKALRGRRLRYDAVTRVGGTLAAVAVTGAVTGFALLLPEVALLKWRSIRAATGNARRSGAEAAESFERRFRYGRMAWRGSAPCLSCGDRLVELTFQDRGRALLHPDHTVRIRCQRCRSAQGGHVIAGFEAEHLTRRLLAYENVAGADDRQLAAAVELIRTGGVGTGDIRSLRRGPPEMLIGLELLVAERREARALGWEIADLQVRWETAEALAQIIDWDLTPAPCRSPGQAAT
jgi:hypothetical protein